MSFDELGEATAELVDLLQAVDGVTVYDEPGANPDPPCVLIGAPSLAWTTQGPEPDEATVNLAIVVRLDDRAMANLRDLVQRVAAAVDQHSSAVVRRATPGSYPAGNTSLPAYDLEVDLGL